MPCGVGVNTMALGMDRLAAIAPCASSSAGRGGCTARRGVREAGGGAEELAEEGGGPRAAAAYPSSCPCTRPGVWTGGDGRVVVVVPCIEPRIERRASGETFGASGPWGVMGAARAVQPAEAAAPSRGGGGASSVASPVGMSAASA